MHTRCCLHKKFGDRKPRKKQIARQKSTHIKNTIPIDWISKKRKRNRRHQKKKSKIIVENSVDFVVFHSPADQNLVYINQKNEMYYQVLFVKNISYVVVNLAHDQTIVFRHVAVVLRNLVLLVLIHSFEIN